VRLDHLLSKEHQLARTHPLAGVLGRWPLSVANVYRAAAHSCGALAIQFAVCASRQVPPTPRSVGVGGERRSRAGGGVGTLLGPEETDPSAPDRATFSPPCWGWVVAGVGAGLFLLDCGAGSGASFLVWPAGGLGCFLRTTQWTRASLIEAHPFGGGFRSAIC
jgi:hypothetical protein